MTQTISYNNECCEKRDKYLILRNAQENVRGTSDEWRHFTNKTDHNKRNQATNDGSDAALISQQRNNSNEQDAPIYSMMD
jgi:hypothetical protein